MTSSDEAGGLESASRACAAISMARPLPLFVSFVVRD